MKAHENHDGIARKFRLAFPISKFPFKTLTPQGSSEKERNKFHRQLLDLRKLMNLAQAGDRNAYRRLLSQAADLLHRYYVNFLPAPAAGQATRNALTIHGVRHTYDPKMSFELWMREIARLRFKDIRRASANTSRVA